MALKLTQIDFKDLFGKFQSLDRIEKRPDGFETCWQWPKELGRGEMRMVKIRPGLILGIADYQLNRDLVISFEHDHSLIDLGFSISGDVTYEICHEKGRQKAFHYRHLHNTINCLPPCRGEGRSLAKRRITCVRIYTEPRILRGLLPGCPDHLPDRFHDIIEGAKHPYFNGAAALPPMCRSAVQQLLDCPYHGPLRQLFLESKTLELITHTMARFSPVHSSFGPGLLQEDLGRVRKAKRLLTQRLENPPSLTELARQVGLNKNKLNRGFRQQYGTSVFEYLRICRLERARILLQTRQKSVTEVAFSVGYRHHANFTRAFKRHFGAAPQALLG